VNMMPGLTYDILTLYGGSGAVPVKVHQTHLSVWCWLLMLMLVIDADAGYWCWRWLLMLMLVIDADVGYW